MSRRLQLLLKRALDLGLAVIGLALLSPLLLLIALLVKGTSTGPILFRQSRLGLEGRPFQIAKFRTMVADAENRARRTADGANQVIADDPRISRVGRWLREWSLDELPQLWNVLLGDMSLVGPRPDELSALPLYSTAQKEKLSMKPGITGLAMVRGRNSIPWPRRIELDIEYIRTFSLWRDLRILVQTVGVLLGRRGIYNPEHDAGQSPRSR